jgi:putative endonuclease
MKSYFVYIMSNKSRRLYTGITSMLGLRVYQHKNKALPGFTARYQFDMLVYFEEYSFVMDAIAREKEIKNWRQEKKLKLILTENPDWADFERGMGGRSIVASDFEHGNASYAQETCD